MIDATQIAAAIGAPCIISAKMAEAMTSWENLFKNTASWQKIRVKPLRLPSIVSKEIKRLTLKEFASEVNDPELNAAWQRMLPSLRRKLDYGLAVGGLLLKPYWTGAPKVDIVLQNQYLPISFSDDVCTSVACPETVVIGKISYTRVEVHEYNAGAQQHSIRNLCFRSDNPAFLGRECKLSEVPAWADILPHKVFDGVTQPLFSIFQVPDANNVDPDSALGISVYADAVDLIRDADEHWERILWELESSERAIDASLDFFRMRDGKPILPRGRERMFHTYENTGNGKDLFNTFSPEIRDTSYFHAFNQILRRIENNCGLAYGTLSEVEDVEKTAEEIKASKQRSYDRVHDIQEGLRPALGGAAYGLSYLRNYYENRGASDVEVTSTFGDGVLEDVDKEFARRMQMVSAGMLTKEQFVMWYFSCDEEAAAELMPKAEALFGNTSPTIGGGNANPLGV